ncbi:hypothetical protein DID75_03580 [Candidatus Marinamargulisbacteria bacterium SCGC AG-410-N11]|nr:hypothetical protein DID75_03580 [Candidatus Marinamargulisbacteria bacterium SCGC AG-410-N11]
MQIRKQQGNDLHINKHGRLPDANPKSLSAEDREIAEKLRDHGLEYNSDTTDFSDTSSIMSGSETESSISDSARINIQQISSSTVAGAKAEQKEIVINPKNKQHYVALHQHLTNQSGPQKGMYKQTISQGLKNVLTDFYNDMSKPNFLSKQNYMKLYNELVHQTGPEKGSYNEQATPALITLLNNFYNDMNLIELDNIEESLSKLENQKSEIIESNMTDLLKADDEKSERSVSQKIADITARIDQTELKRDQLLKAIPMEILMDRLG